MIVVKLIGGLGNQMFQYAAGRYLSKLHNTELLLDTSFLNQDAKGAYTHRNYELSVFKIEAKIAAEKDISVFKAKGNSGLIRTLQRKLPILFSHLYVAESGFNYHKEFLSYPKNTYLDGFWQSELYFKPIETTINQDFSFKEKPTEKNCEWQKKINAVNSVSIHVRRGDYVHSKNANAHHGTCDLTYYERAVGKLIEAENNIELFIFSDDLEWCRANFKFSVPTLFVDCNVHSNFHFDLFLMSECKHNIIANSSFSWWGAWLNKHAAKKVIAPEKWFNDPSTDTSDLIPETWMRL